MEDKNMDENEDIPQQVNSAEYMGPEEFAKMERSEQTRYLVIKLTEQNVHLVQEMDRHSRLMKLMIHRIKMLEMKMLKLKGVDAENVEVQDGTE